MSVLTQKKQTSSKQLNPFDRADYLKAVSLFSEIREQPGAIEFLANLMNERVYEPGQPIINEGETGSEMYFLIMGHAAVFKTTSEGESYKVVILTEAQHAFFGEGGLLDADARSATIKAETLCHCLVLNRESFEKLGLQNPAWALPILRKIARTVLARLRKSNDDLMLLYNALVAEIRGH